VRIGISSSVTRAISKAYLHQEGHFEVKISLLHISDLHRDPRNLVSNEALLNSLVQDVENSISEEPSITPPQIIIVSGDIIQGTGKDTESPDDLLREQYCQAEHFLGDLADKLLGGNRQKLIIVPGNHDINFSKMFSALKEIDYGGIDAKKRSELAGLIWAPQSNFRWSWIDFKLYEINNKVLYEQRLGDFIAFYDRFYSGTRSYSEDPKEQFDVFDFPEYNLAIAGFNSCFLNDPWHRQGAIHPQAFANCCTEMRGRQYRGRVRMAVWHHSTKGAPRQDDYMDTDFLQQLINHGFSLGFHGHQHKPELIDEEYAFGGEEKVNVLSASTLAGSERALAPGATRGYNRVMLDTNEWSVELHVRQMANSDFLNPIWCKGSLSNQKNCQKFPLQQPKPVNQAVIASQDLPEAEQLLRGKRHEEAAAILEPIAPHNDLAKRLLLKAMEDGNDREGIARCFPEPISSEEIIAVLDALWELERHDHLKDVLSQLAVSEHEDPAVKAFRTKLLGRLG